jgi:predicted small metal-binding protein
MPKRIEKSTDKDRMPDTPGTNPSVNPQTGAVNPSAPTVGTEQWGNTSDERRVLGGEYAPGDMRAGQMKGNPGDSRTAQTQHASERATTNKSRHRGRDKDMDQADLSSRTSASAFSMNTSHGGQDHTFRCADAGNSDCRWQTSGDTEDEVMRHVEEHWRGEHGLKDWTAALRNHVHDNIRRRRAA